MPVPLPQAPSTIGLRGSASARSAHDNQCLLSHQSRVEFLLEYLFLLVKLHYSFVDVGNGALLDPDQPFADIHRDLFVTAATDPELAIWPCDLADPGHNRSYCAAPMNFPNASSA